MSERFEVLLQYGIPKHALTTAAGVFAKARGRGATTKLIRWFVQRYGVDMSEAAEPALDAYASFNDFFTRPLKPGVRPIADADWVCPVDGAISQFGAIDGSRLIQAKGHAYTTLALLGGDAELAAEFEHGSFATLYLSPKDYHRIHMPRAGTVDRMIYVPGDFFSVNPATARGVPGLFARNERVVCIFRGERGRFAVVLVGATIVGSMATVWHGVVKPRRRRIQEWRYENDAARLGKGAEMGRFLLGSTVVLLFPRPRLDFNAAWAPGGAVRLGEAMADLPRAAVER